MTDPSTPDTAQLDTVDGWFYAVDVDFFSTLLGCQTAEDIKGDMLEIGTYRGKSAILMGYGLRDDEELMICDLFSAVMDHADIPLNRRQQYSGLEQDEFLANWDVSTLAGQRLKSANHQNSTSGTGHSASSTSTVVTAISALPRTSASPWSTRPTGA